MRQNPVKITFHVTNSVFKGFLKDVIPSGYRRGEDGHYYKVPGEEKNWDDAQRTCSSDGANLPIISDDLTRGVVLRLMPAGGWIGAFDQRQEGVWKTPNMDNLLYAKWAKGEPNNKGNADCAFQGSDGLWNDFSCKDSRPFICQILSGENLKCLTNLSYMLSDILW